MRIVFDLDNTLVDEQGRKCRPGGKNLLEKLKKDGHTLILWTNSIRSRAQDILKDHNISHFFSKTITREDYDPSSLDGWKDIRKVKGDILIDDNPE